MVAQVTPSREEELRKLLASMNRRPGVVDPHNDLVAFGKLDRLHFARFVLLSDQTRADVIQHGAAPAEFPLSLAFLADFDGPIDAFLSDLLGCAGLGLRRIFVHCAGFSPDGDLRRWVRSHQRRASANYVNWRGRTVRQIREEAALHDALVSRLRESPGIAALGPCPARDALVSVVKKDPRVTLTRPAPTSLRWRLRNLAHAVLIPVAVLLLLPLLILYLPIFLIQLRRRERRDPEIVPAPAASHVRTLADLEDHDVTNQFSALGTVKRGRFRSLTLRAGLLGLDWAARHVYTRGHLTRVSTIHFARWVFVDRDRLLFASNYDGSLESYMDDFINKVGWGLNLVFSNGVGWPRTDYLVLQGASDEQKFKRYLRRHQLPTDVWYNAQPGLTAMDLAHNTKIRQGFERRSMTDVEARAWLRLL